MLDLLAAEAREGHKITVAVVIELLIPLAVCGLVAWGFWLWYRLRLVRAEATERMREELAELRAYKQDTEARLQALETIATLGEGRVRIDHDDAPEDEDERRRRKG
ncbi:MAG: hypothetical protein WCE62_14330 [Polyangiales bacterium]